MNRIGHVFSIARKEWRWIAQNPMSDVRRPKAAPLRDHRVSENEIERINVATGRELAVLALARKVERRNIKMRQVYYYESASDGARKL
jgi:hypothetical protein